MKKRQSLPLPLPRTWLTRAPEENKANDRETILAGKRLNPGSKAYLRNVLLNAGWEPEIVDHVLNNKAPIREYLTDLVQEQRKDADVNAALLVMKEKGYKAQTVALSEQGSRYTQEIWDSFTRFPWWTAALRGKRSIVLVANSASSARRATASFMRDLWVNLGEAPAHRLPVVRRVNVLGYASASGVNSFEASVSQKVDVVVAHGLETSDLVYQMFGYAAALAQVPPHAMMVYEAVVSPAVSRDVLLAAAQRSGFSFIFGVGRG